MMKFSDSILTKPKSLKLCQRTATLLLLILSLWLVAQVNAAPQKLRFNHTVTIDERVEVQVALARSFKQRVKGLGEQSHLPEGKGLLFIYKTAGERTIWMKGMQFAIDILWIRDNRIVHIEQDVAPPANGADYNLAVYGAGVLADRVLEVPAGYCAQQGIQLNQQLQLGN